MLSGWSELWMKCQDFFHRGQLVWELRIQGHAFQLIPDPQPHQIITSKLRTGHALTLFPIKRP